MQNVTNYLVLHSCILKVRNIGSALVLIYPTGFFDGVAANYIGGVGISLLINQSHRFDIKMGCGKSTNTRVELMALLALMYFSKEIGIPMMHIFGDSYVIINWENASFLSLL